MPDYTPNYEFVKPKRNEPYDVELFNQNVQKIDENLSRIETDFTTQLEQTKVELSQRTRVSRNKTKKPTLVISFDDGQNNEYTKTLPLLESLGIKATFYHNTSPRFINRLSAVQILDMHAKGHEFGSHTRDHVYLGQGRGVSDFAQGATEIKINNTTNYPFFEIYDIETRFRVIDAVSWQEYELVGTSANLSGNVLTITLSEPLAQTIQNPYISYADSFIREQFQHPIDFFDRLNIPCTHIAYPYGVSDAHTRNLASQYYVSARTAINMATSDVNLMKPNGGTIRNVETAIDQFEIYAGDLGGSNTVDIDRILNEGVSLKGMVVFLAHASNYDSWSAQLTHTVNKARQLGYEITTMSKALETHGNALEIGNFKLSPQGNPRGAGVDVKPFGSIAYKENANNFKEGITIINAEASDNKGYPTQNGTLVHLRSSTSVEHLGWSKELWLDKNSHRMWIRRNTGNVEYTEFKRVLVEGEQIEFREFTIPSVEISAGGTYRLATGIIFSTNVLSFDFISRSTGLSSAKYKGIVVDKRVENGELRIDLINTSDVNYTMQATPIIIIVHIF